MGEKSHARVNKKLPLSFPKKKEKNEVQNPL